MKALPKIASYQPTGKQVLFTVITHEEIVGSNIIVTKNEEIPQARIEGLGPEVLKTTGLAVGQRVIINGPYTKLLTTLADGKRRGVCEPETIKAVCVEED